ncbi:unnamed protein product [Phytophthora fragariaefolia]|uniref:Unnamed protein product n=1 Tax=Phytophthora fragariaefolia TaxID=1490495 RepID=A0A9W7D3C5_9STRA|nr:unnamed protein product [Phytophthora fragariaefolia]
MLATLDSGPARVIPEACEWLLVKAVPRPIEEDDEFPEYKSAGSDQAKTGNSASLYALMQQMQSFMQQQQLWQQKMMQNRWQPPRSPRNRLPTVSAVTHSGNEGNGLSGNARLSRGISMSPDSRTQEGIPVCGRCGYLGHSREVCSRVTMTCISCGTLGRIGAECTGASGGRDQTYQGSAGRGGGRRALSCFFGGESGHMVSQCPTVRALKGLAGGTTQAPEVPNQNP